MFRVRLCAALATVLVGFAVPARALFPYPACNSCSDPADYQAYLFNPPTVPPTLPGEVGPLDFRFSSLVDPALPSTSEELFGVAGMSIDLAWQFSTGRPDVVIAILDSGVIYDSDLINKAKLNTSELPLPEGSSVYDANGDGVVNVADYSGDSRVSDIDGNGFVDPRDLILVFGDGVDDDANGYIDDICGWDVHEDDNDPFDDVSYRHGTGEAKGAVGEAENGGGIGVAPSAMFLPVKVSDSFVADADNFAQGVVFAVDSGVTIVSEALGALNNSRFAQQAVEYAWNHGVPVVASAADEQSYHHNYPAAYNHTFWANSIRPQDGLAVTDPTNLLFNGCTNYSGHAQVAVSSTACSSEATEKAAGAFALMYSQALNQIDRGVISAHPLTGKALSPNEALQLLSMTADDVDFSTDTSLTISSILSSLLPGLTSRRVPSHAGFDKYTGYGRANVATAMARIAPGTIPPEADITSPSWFDNIDPTLTPTVDVVGTVAAWRNSNNFTYSVEWACGVDPLEADFQSIISMPMSGSPIQDGLLASWNVSGVETACSFDTLTLPRSDPDDFDESYAVTLRVSVVDTLGNRAEARKNVTVYNDPSLRPAFPVDLGASGDGAPVLADLNGDGAQEIILATADGTVHALDAGAGELPGWPVTTDLLALHLGSNGYQSTALGSDFHAAVLGSPAVGDLDGNGSLEVVVADLKGSVYAFESDGSPRAGFPVSLDPVFSDPAIRNEANRVDFGVVATPTLADLDGDGSLEIIIAAMDRHLYVWNGDGSVHAGFPVLIVDQERMASVDPTTGQVVWKQIGGSDVGSRGTKLIGSPAVGDIDGDGQVEIVVGSNEEYDGGEQADFRIFGTAFSFISAAFDLPNGRLYAVSHLGNLDPAVAGNPSGPFLSGWPSRIGLFLADLLPTVGHGVNANPVLADVDGDGAAEIFINGNNGPPYLLSGDGSSFYGTDNGQTIVFETLYSSFTNPGAGSVDLPYSFALLGSAAVGDVNGNGLLDMALPSVGMRKLIDAQAAGLQGPSDHQLTVWSAESSTILSDFPQPMEDLQFLSSPAIADLDGDGNAEVLEGSGGYYVHAWRGTGGEPTGWPKFTGGWSIGSLAVGDIDGNDLIDVVAMTREGRLYAWETPGSFSSGGNDNVQWATAARDTHHSGNLNSGVATVPLPAGCASMFRSVVKRARAIFRPAAGDDRIKVKGSFNIPGESLDPTTEEFSFAFGGPAGPVYEATVPAGSMTASSRSTVFRFTDRTLTLAGGIRRVVLKNKKGQWLYAVTARSADAETGSDMVLVRLRIGDLCMKRTRQCELAKSGKSLRCR